MPAADSPATARAVFLRGINVGPHKRIPMAGLRDALAAAGYAGVRTLLQSGNVVLSAAEPADATATRVEAVVADAFGFDVPAVARTVAHLEGAVAADPLRDVATDPARHLVGFLSNDADPGALVRLLSADYAPERVAAAGRDVHLWCPDGIGTSPLVRDVERAGLAPVVTMRNWNTVLKVLALANGEPTAGAAAARRRTLRPGWPAGGPRGRRP